MQSNLEPENQSICHQGEVVGINGESYDVKINPESACHHCHSKILCSVAGLSDRIIQCRAKGGTFSMGQQVLITMEEKMGTIALFYAFGLPFLVIIASLVFFKILGVGDKFAGLFSIISLLPYYLILSKLSRKLTKDFRFMISKDLPRGDH